MPSRIDSFLSLSLPCSFQHDNMEPMISQKSSWQQRANLHRLRSLSSPSNLSRVCPLSFFRKHPGTSCSYAARSESGPHNNIKRHDHKEDGIGWLLTRERIGSRDLRGATYFAFSMIGHQTSHDGNPLKVGTKHRDARAAACTLAEGVFRSRSISCLPGCYQRDIVTCLSPFRRGPISHPVRLN